MHAILLGASRGCGYHLALSLLEAGHSVSLLLRHSEAFQSGAEVAALLASDSSIPSRLYIQQGDATSSSDLATLFASVPAEQLELVFSSVGGAPVRKGWGFGLDVPDITQRVATALLPEVKKAAEARADKGLKCPRVIVVSSMGLGSTHDDLPMLLKPLYGWLLHQPHEDKIQQERLVYAAAGIRNEDLEVNQKEQVTLAEPAWLTDFIILRPALLTGGKATGKCRAAEVVGSAYTISRADVSHWVMTQALPGQDEFKGKAVVLAY